MTVHEPTKYDELVDLYKIASVLHSDNPSDGLRRLVRFALADLGWDNPNAFTFAATPGPPPSSESVRGQVSPMFVGVLEIRIVDDLNDGFPVHYGRQLGFPTGPIVFEIPRRDGKRTVEIKDRASIAEVAELLYNEIKSHASR